VNNHHVVIQTTSRACLARIDIDSALIGHWGDVDYSLFAHGEGIGRALHCGRGEARQADMGFSGGGLNNNMLVV